MQHYIFKRLALSAKEIAQLRAEAPEVHHRSLAVVLDPAALVGKQATPVDVKPAGEHLNQDLQRDVIDLELVSEQPGVGYQHDLVCEAK